ncbi:hypothetical protein EV424DRAFT_1329677, partial [Suillus variegatus]
PYLPFKPRSNNLLDIYNISMHIIPAANPRVTLNIPVPGSPPCSSKRHERDIKNLGLELMKQARQGEDGYSGVMDERLLWNCVDRYVKKDRKDKVRTKGIALFLVHATGFPKELIWETTLCYLLAACGVIDEIWSWQSVQHEDSALLNGQNLSGSCEMFLRSPAWI